jgi:hypothetical protein
VAVTSDQVYGDSEWLHAQPGFKNQFSQLLMQYGIVPDAATLAQYGLSDMFDPAQATAAANNPYSVAAQLKNTLSGSLTNNATSANSHGALFSGAFANMQDAAGRDYTKNYSLAGQSELGGLGALQTSQGDLYDSIWKRLMDAPPVAAAPGPDPGAIQTPGNMPVGTPIGVGTATPIPQGPYIRTGPEAGSVAPVAPKKPKPIVGGMGHVT